MSDVVMPAGYAVLVWWFTTGLILFLDGLRPATFRWSLGVATVGLAAAAYAIHQSAVDASVAGAYTAFTCTVLAWGWLEMSFLMGFITGPRKQACKEPCAGWRHFVHATQAIIYNELATVALAAAITALTWRAPNRCALGTFLVLWSMRLSAKLNLYLGVPNLGDKFLPPHLQYLKGFFKKRPMNFLFPLSITASTVVAALLIQQWLVATDVFAATERALVTSLLVLAIIEHWFMVIPLPSERLWNWALRSRRASRNAPIDRRVPGPAPP